MHETPDGLGLLQACAFELARAPKVPGAVSSRDSTGHGLLPGNKGGYAVAIGPG